MGCDEKYKTRRVTRLVLLNGPKTGSGAWGVFRGSPVNARSVEATHRYSGPRYLEVVPLPP